MCVRACVRVCEHDHFALWMFFALLEVCNFISVHVYSALFVIVSDFEDKFCQFFKRGRRPLV